MDLVTTYQITLDTKNTDIKVLRVKQYDEGSRLLTITLLSDGEPIDLSGCSVSFKGSTPDDRILLLPCEIYDGNKVDLDITYNVCVVSGRVNAEILIYNDKRLISTMPFILQVIPSVWDDDRLQGSDELSVLTYLLTHAQGYIDEIIETNTTVQNAENIRIASEELRVSNEETRVSNENTRIENENQRITNEVIRQDNESERKSLFDIMTDEFDDIMHALEIEGFIFLTSEEVQTIIDNTYTDTSEEGSFDYVSHEDIENIIDGSY